MDALLYGDVPADNDVDRSLALASNAAVANQNSILENKMTKKKKKNTLNIHLQKGRALSAGRLNQLPSFLSMFRIVCFYYVALTQKTKD